MLLLLIKLFSQEKKIKGKFQFRDTTTAQFSKHQKSFPTLVVWKHSNLRAQPGRGRTDRVQDMSSTASPTPTPTPTLAYQGEAYTEGKKLKLKCSSFIWLLKLPLQLSL